MPPGKIREVATFGDAPVPSGDGKLFCERVCQLIENPSLAGDMGAAASEKISLRFSAGRMCREVEEIYDRYLK
jgi:glycosyltransferase involved in cell wall biosynthesis